MDAQSIYSNFRFSLTFRVLWIKQPHQWYPLLLIYRNHLSQSIWFSWIWASWIWKVPGEVPPLHLSLSNSFSKHGLGPASELPVGLFNMQSLSFHPNSLSDFIGSGTQCLHLIEAPRQRFAALTNPSLCLACDPRLPRGLPHKPALGELALPPTVKWSVSLSTPLPGEPVSFLSPRADRSPLLTGLVSHL